jgi:hypothetical protein
MLNRPIAMASVLALLVSVPAFAQDGGSRAAGPETLLGEMAGWVGAVEAKLEEAATDNEDATLYDCLSSVLANMSAYQVLADEAMGRLAGASNDPAAAADATDLIQLAHAQVFALRAEADSCSSDVINYAGDQQRDATVNGRIPRRDTTNVGGLTSPTLGSDVDDDSDDRNTPVL